MPLMADHVIAYYLRKKKTINAASKEGSQMQSNIRD